MGKVNEVNNSSDPHWGQKRYQDNPPLVNARVDPITVKSNIAGYYGWIYTSRLRTYVPESPYPNGQPVNPIPARRAGNTQLARPYVMAFESWINNAKRVFGVFMPNSGRPR